jgi:LPXTG-motif cell wall-anchored protein
MPQAAAVGDSSNSPGVLSGNSVQVPVSSPLNVCGNSVDVVGLLNQTPGNACGSGDASSSTAGGPVDQNGNPVTPPAPAPVVPAAPAPVVPAAPAPATPVVPAPVVPVGQTGSGDDVPGTSVDVPRTDPTAESPNAPLPETEFTTPVMDDAPLVERASSLAHTGSEDMIAASAAGAALLLGGAILYRRGRVAARR